MAASEPWMVETAILNSEPNPVTTAVLDAEIESLAAAKNTVEITPVKVAFEFSIIILTLVRVRIPVLFPILHLLIGDTTRMR